MSVTQDEKSAARSLDGQGSVEAAHPGASPEGEHRHFKARRDWLSPERAKAYRESRRPSQYARYYTEEAIVVPWLEDLPRHARILDVPCGTGRWIPAQTGRGYRYVGADVSPHMVREARQLTGPPAVSGLLVADLAHLPFPDESFDAVVLWRLLHHVPDSPTRKRLLAEAARVSRYKVILSFHHPYSLTYVTKVIRRTLFGFKQGGRGITHWQLKEEAATAGLTVLETRSFWKYASINWFACLAKTSALNDAGRVR
jgi:SAM-dependent methyltransferase